MQDAWLIRFKEVVQREIDEAGGRRADGYRAVASKTGLGYDYVYQIFTGKPLDKPKQPGPDAMSAIERVYGRADAAPAPVAPPAPAPATGLSALEQALQLIDDALAPLDALDRRAALSLLTIGMERPGRASSVALTFSGAITSMSSKRRAA